MWIRGRSYRGRRYRRGGKRAYKSLKRKVPRTIRKYVKATIHKNLENKEILDYFANNTLQTLSSGTNTGVCCRQLLPLPANGTASNQRVGNMIKITKGVIRGSVNIKPYDVATNPAGAPLLGRIIVFRDLTIAGTQAISSGSYTTYFDYFFKGNNTSLPFQGNPLDMSLPINDDNFRILGQKLFKIGTASNSTTGPVGSGSYADNSPMSIPFYFNWGKYVKKVIKFNENNSYPQNANCYIVCQVVRADGTSSGSYQMAEWHAVNHIKFEDA